MPQLHTIEDIFDMAVLVHVIFHGTAPVNICIHYTCIRKISMHTL